MHCLPNCAANSSSIPWGSYHCASASSFTDLEFAKGRWKKYFGGESAINHRQYVSTYIHQIYLHVDMYEYGTYICRCNHHTLPWGSHLQTLVCIAIKIHAYIFTYTQAYRSVNTIRMTLSVVTCTILCITPLRIKHDQTILPIILVSVHHHTDHTSHPERERFKLSRKFQDQSTTPSNTKDLKVSFFLWPMIFRIQFSGVLQNKTYSHLREDSTLQGTNTYPLQRFTGKEATS